MNPHSTASSVSRQRAGSAQTPAPSCSPAIASRFECLWRAVGNTPMFRIAYRYRGQPRQLFAKSEHYNLTGSIKDRMALHILEQSYLAGQIKPGNIIVEATSGNTGIAFAALGKALGHRVRIIMPNWLSKERMDIIRSLGAEIILVGKEEGGFLGSIALSENMAAEDADVFLPCQFSNCLNADAHARTTGPEIWRQLQSVGLKPNAFVAGVGTGGTVMGVGRYLRKLDASVAVHPLEPAESPTLSTGHKVGAHRIQGISDEFIPAIVELDQLSPVIQASDGDSILLAQKLASQLGLAVGISSGANILGAIQLQNQLGADAVVATVLSDSNKKYLSTDLMRPEPVKDHYLSPEVEFVEFQPLPRAF
jgi:cysteine synthase